MMHGAYNIKKSFFLFKINSFEKNRITDVLCDFELRTRYMPVTKGKINRKCSPAFNLIIYFCLCTTVLQMEPQHRTARAFIIKQSPRNETVMDPTKFDYGLLMT